jgi:hypothetical protein
MGPPLRIEDGLFLTWHFSLFSSLFNRMKRSKRRTFDPEKASLFIIPYDLGIYFHGYSVKVYLSLGCSLISVASIICVVVSFTYALLAGLRLTC